MKLEMPSQNIASLYTKEIEAILYSVYNKTMFWPELRKPDHMKALEKELSTNTNEHEGLLLTLAVPVVAPVEAPAPTTATAAAAALAI